MTMTELPPPAPAELVTVNTYGVRVGDIFYCSWGYDQTNVDYYLVTRVTRHKAEIVPIGSKVVEANGPGGNKVVPNPDCLREWDVLININRGDAKRSKLCSVTNGYRGEPSLVLKSGQYWAWRHHGGSHYETDSMFGH